MLPRYSIPNKQMKLQFTIISLEQQNKPQHEVDRRVQRFSDASDLTRSGATPLFMSWEDGGGRFLQAGPGAAGRPSLWLLQRAADPRAFD